MGKRYRTCVVPGCKLKESEETPAFKAIPKDKTRREKWIEGLKAKTGQEVKPGKDSRICTTHFVESDFETGFALSGPEYRSYRLKRIAVPEVPRTEEQLREYDQKRLRTCTGKATFKLQEHRFPDVHFEYDGPYGVKCRHCNKAYKYFKRSDVVIHLKTHKLTQVMHDKALKKVVPQPSSSKVRPESPQEDIEEDVMSFSTDENPQDIEKDVMSFSTDENPQDIEKDVMMFTSDEDIGNQIAVDEVIIANIETVPPVDVPSSFTTNKDIAVEKPIAVQRDTIIEIPKTPVNVPSTITDEMIINLDVEMMTHPYFIAFKGFIWPQLKNMNDRQFISWLNSQQTFFKNGLQ
ncbi:hypothetical protein DMENIID0001_010190 [Sergentomyia squamirostris]